MQLHRSNDSTAEEQVDLFRFGKSWMQQLELMPSKRKSRSKSELIREPFTTIDDLVEQAQDLFAGLKNLSERKHPLDIRRGVRRGVVDVSDQNERSKTVKAGSKTYFFDLKEAKDGKPYLLITESRFKGEGEERERMAIVVFPENAKEFSEAVSEMTAHLEK